MKLKKKCWKIFFSDYYKSIVFLDLETTDLKFKEITEICFYEVLMNQFIELRESLRITNFFNPLKTDNLKLQNNNSNFTLVFKPEINISKDASNISKINNNMIAYFNKLSKSSCLQISKFLETTQKPTLLLGYNSENYDLPVLMRKFEENNVEFTNDIDSLDLYQIIIKFDKKYH